MAMLSARPDFSAFIGIDWSGAKGERHGGLQLACAKPGKAVPETLAPPSHSRWSRPEVMACLAELAAQAGDQAVLVGIDFAFAHPFDDYNSYFPRANGLVPENPASLWRLVDDVNADQRHLYGGAMFQHPIWGRYYLAPPKFDADRYQSRRRLTEYAAREAGKSPSPTFKAVGADNVCTGSLAGMRLLHQLKTALGAALTVWPFEPLKAGVTKLVLVEIFPSFYFHHLDLVPDKNAAAKAAFLNRALHGYDSAGVAADFVAAGHDADEADALISAAALRHFASNGGFDLAPAIQRAAQQEGWIFGVPPVPA